ncbi:uncharacterized protein LOC121969456 [Zingiber officinale]|uniref:Uncharacterized protein n=1 Tax=Zingiber officinale TaxID=94328 RepID=A0A8J5LCZ3_ZINOF|nr:uncharacterized protein LOC121969456 [Zingiber officinale]KAG6513421.1 hypothetical protein ZIOFF_023745 [Zingiber officinale]
MAMALPRAPPPRSQLPAEASHPSTAQRSASFPTMPDIIAASRAQGLRLRLQVLGPFFRVRAEGEDGSALGRAEGVVRPWVAGKVLHLDSMRLSRDTLSMDRSIFGLGLFVGAAAVRHGYDQGCRTAQLLAINDSPLFHSKLVRFYTRMGFKVVHEVDGSSMGDLAHMLVWGGRGTRMDADIEQLFLRWGKKFKASSSGNNCTDLKLQLEIGKNNL